MAENVVALPGFAVPRPENEPDQEIVSQLEDLLAAAKSGSLVGIAYATVSCNPTRVGSAWHSGIYRHDLAAAVMMLSHRLSYALAED